MRFDNRHDACMRLENTVVLWKGRAAKVEGITEGLRLNLKDLQTGRVCTVAQDAATVQLRAPSLGYVNGPAGAAYIVRKPARMWKQGLDRRHLAYVAREATRPDLAHWLDQPFIDCYNNVYPTLEQSLKLIEGGSNPFKQAERSSVAFCKHWAVDKHLKLHYKGAEVGELKDEPRLLEGYLWLSESLQEAIDEAS